MGQRSTRKLLWPSESLDIDFFLICLLPSTPKTRGLLNVSMLRSACKSTSSLFRGPLLINAGRGDLITEEDLLAAFDEGLLCGAVLDVFAAEPLTSSSPLWNHSDVVITPHVAMLSFRSDAVEVFYKNLARLDAKK